MKMRILDLAQGSDEWLEARLKYLCASEAPAMMGESKFMSRNQLLAIKKGWQSNPVGDFKQRLFDKGHENEDAARFHIEMELLTDMPPTVGLRTVDGLPLLSSFDGYGDSDPTIWEHKDWNEILSENVRNAVLEPLYYWQLEHQMLTADTKSVRFTVSDGTTERRVSMIYVSQPMRRAELIAGWKQFLVDLDNYEIEARAEIVAANDIETLPTIQYRVEGAMVVSNIKDCVKAIRDRSTLENSRILETEQDFADKDQLNKDTKKARDKLKNIVSAVQSEFVSYSEFADAAAEIDGILQKMQSHGEKQIKEHKSRKKQSIIDVAQKSLDDHISECEERIKPHKIRDILGGLAIRPDFITAMKNKRTIDSWVNAADDAATSIKIDINNAMKNIEPNLSFFRSESAGKEFLFSDIACILNQPSEAFSAIVMKRIADHTEKVAAEMRHIADHAEKVTAEIQKEATIKALEKPRADAEKQPTRISPQETKAIVTMFINFMQTKGAWVYVKNIGEDPQEMSLEEVMKLKDEFAQY